VPHASRSCEDFLVTSNHATLWQCPPQKVKAIELLGEAGMLDRHPCDQHFIRLPRILLPLHKCRHSWHIIGQCSLLWATATRRPADKEAKRTSSLPRSWHSPLENGHTQLTIGFKDMRGKKLGFHQKILGIRSYKHASDAIRKTPITFIPMSTSRRARTRPSLLKLGTGDVQ
jgi:hypothetical protein